MFAFRPFKRFYWMNVRLTAYLQVDSRLHRKNPLKFAKEMNEIHACCRADILSAMRRSVTARQRLLLNMHACVLFVCLVNSWSLCGECCRKKLTQSPAYDLRQADSALLFTHTLYLALQTNPTKQTCQPTQFIALISFRFLVDLNVFTTTNARRTGENAEKIRVYQD